MCLLMDAVWWMLVGRVCLCWMLLATPAKATGGPDSCEGKCGTYTHGGGNCFCDSKCVSTQDCCSDYLELCSRSIELAASEEVDGTRFVDTGMLMAETFVLAFEVQTCGQVTVRLEAVDFASNGSYYLITFDSANATHSITRCDPTCGDTTAVEVPGLLNCSSAEKFWICWNGSSIRVGQGWIRHHNQLMAFNELNPFVIATISFGTHEFNSSWTFIPIYQCEFCICEHASTCVNVGLNEHRCDCPSSRSEDDCTVNPCLAEPCDHDGVCSSIGDDYCCVCEDLHSGKNCQLTNNPCAASPCTVNCTCQALDASSFNCLCPTIQPLTCQDENPCDHTPCHNGGTCTRISASLYTCQCPVLFTGPRCISSVDPCVYDPCVNGKLCTRIGVCSFACICTEITDVEVANLTSVDEHIDLVTANHAALLPAPLEAWLDQLYQLIYCNNYKGV